MKSPPKRKRLELTGQKFGQYEVLRYSHSKRFTYWWCRCSCGSEKAVIGSHLVSGAITKCQKCALKIITAKAKASGAPARNMRRLHEQGLNHRPTKHGHSNKSDPTYNSWLSMKRRCYEKTHIKYQDYGVRGITVCDRWLGDEGFANFLSDMGERPKGHTLDRLDNELGYCKANCRWSTPKQQATNQRSNRLLTFNGETLTVTEWAKRVGITHTGLTRRLDRGWSVERTLTTPRLILP